MQAEKETSSDEALVAAFRQNADRQALGLLYRRYAHLVLGLCLDYLKNREDARDAVMDIFEKATVKLGEQEIKTFKTWIFYVTRNYCIDLLRRRVANTPAEFSEAFFVDSDPDTRPYDDQRIEWLSEAMALLKPHQRDCILLFYLQGKSYEEVAKVTGFTEKEIKSYLQNGRRNLKHILLKMEHERAER